MTKPPASTERVRDYWDEQAARYDRMMERAERFIGRDGRDWVCSRATGRTLEVAIGTGRNLGRYGPDVELTAIDLSPRMLEHARKRADDLGLSVDLRVADAQALPFGPAEFDTVTCTLSLCAVPDLPATLSEIARVLRPGGKVILLDHVRPRVAPLRWLLTGLQWATNRFVPSSGEQYLRRPLEHLEARGYRIELVQSFKGGAIERLVAGKPAETQQPS